MTITGIASGATTGNYNIGVHISGASIVTGATDSLIEGTGGGLLSLSGTLNHGVFIDPSIQESNMLPMDEVIGDNGFGATSLNRSGLYA